MSNLERFVGIGTDKPRDTSPTHCAPSLIVGTTDAAAIEARPEPEAWDTPTTWLQRFGDALQLLCGGNRPPDETMTAWADKTSEELQSFAASHGPSWAQGIGVIDAAHILADQPTEILRIDGPQTDHERRALEARQVPEPVGVYAGEHRDGADMIRLDRDIPIGAPLFAAPAEQQVPAVPEGWVLVPVKLTREMAMAWKQAGEVAMSTNSTRYAAMLNAAPTAPAPKEKP